MPKLVVMITARIDQGHLLAEAWHDAGAPGVTVIGSYGIHGLRDASRSSELLSGTFSLLRIFRETDETSLFILSVVEEEGMVDRLIKVTEDLVGDLEKPHNGVLFVVDVERIIGLRAHKHAPDGS